MKEIIHTNNAPAALGPYSQGTKFGNLVFTSGQIAIDPQTGDIINDTIENETRQVMKNLGAILKEAGLGFADVLKCSVFVSDMHMYGRINAVYAEFFDEKNAPARELVEVVNLPKFVNIEISAIAAKV